MRLIIATTAALALAACGSESEPRQQPAAAGAVSTPAAAAATAPMMAIPDDPEAVKRLEAMGYTVHKEQNHLHAPGVTGCPAMGQSAAM